MQPATLIAHAKVLASAVLAAIVGGGTTLIGQGVPDPKVQGTVAFIFAAFTWATSLAHRWATSPADAKQEVKSDLEVLLREVLPVVERVLAGMATRPGGPSSGSSP